ncbi:sm-like protein lsm36b [Phtheirospermum japonicum]|uniref:Sm-like protein lsm36b n=1 Tax=Phtheirospermum japonicum TaxID=374723 RepID=A0A830B8H0_9LAMI|nr:sm-like protein lsm36b [Phtheirospermum japonicum]
MVGIGSRSGYDGCRELGLDGILACLDGYMNIAMEQTEEYVNGQLKNKYGDAFIRGNNVLYISTSKGTLAEGA